MSAIPEELRDQQLDDFVQLSADLLSAARIMRAGEARDLVDGYYQVQEMRKSTGNQLLALHQADKPSLPVVLPWLHEYFRMMENRIKRLLGEFAEANEVGRWCLSIYGIGPVISAGLLAHIDIEQAPTVGHIWSFAGLNPEQKWEKGEKRPWNARLKTLCWKIGESFVKQSADKCLYRGLYDDRKQYEQEKNMAGDYADQAAAILAKRPNHKQAAIYKEGHLPDGHIHMRAKRWTVKLFLAHWHHVSYEVHYGELPPKPYVVEHLGHADIIGPPEW